MIATWIMYIFALLLQVFLNEDEDCEGPEVLHTPGLMVEVASTAVAGAGAATVSGVAGLRAVLVQEYEVKHQFFPLAALPKTMADLLDTLN